MKPKNTDLPSVYDAKLFSKAGLKTNNFLLVTGIVVLLALVRLLNPLLWWFTTKQELSSNSVVKNVAYTFIDFSSQEDAEQKMTDTLLKTDADRHSTSTRGVAAKIQVVAYFNFMHPAGFVVHNPNDAGVTPVDLGRVIVMADAGRSYYLFSLDGTVSKVQGNMQSGPSATARIERPPLLMMLAPSKKKSGVSFTFKDPEKSFSLKLPYLLYFLLPLLLILLFASMYSRAMYTAFFYFPLLFLLFDFRLYFFRVPFYWLTSGMSDSLINTLESTVPPILAILMLAAGIYGMMQWKTRRDNFKEAMLVFLLLLLPIILRF